MRDLHSLEQKKTSGNSMVDRAEEPSERYGEDWSPDRQTVYRMNTSNKNYPVLQVEG